MLNFVSKLNKKFFISLICIMIIFLLSYLFMEHNKNLYNKTIAKITSINEEISNVENVNGTKEQIKNQKIKAIILNGSFKGKEVELLNKTSFSQINDLNLKVNDEVFIALEKNDNTQLLSGKILDFKRDKYIGYISIFFIFLILIIGKYKGLRSLISVIINILIFLLFINMFLKNANFILTLIFVSILFTILSITIVCGVNKKTLSAIISTLITTLITIIVSLLVIKLNNWNGVHFENMEFLTHPPVKIFIAELVIGILGAVMDISISISSFIKEIYDINPNIKTKKIVQSTMELGKDMMGTMTNTLLLAYISGSIPIILLLLKNNYRISYIININLSLEFIRALTGSIGIVLCIPISIYTSVFFITNYKIGDITK